MAAMYLTLRGTPILYYGEEIGMQNNDPQRREDVKDPIGRLGWPKEKGRDGERTPMQWNDEPNAGFTTGIPWNAIPVTYKTYNVEDEAKDPNSILNWYKALLALRHTDPALLDGAYIPLNESDAEVLSYLRKASGYAVLVAINMSAVPRAVHFDLAPAGYCRNLGQNVADYAVVAERKSLNRANLAGTIWGLHRGSEVARAIVRRLLRIAALQYVPGWARWRPPKVPQLVVPGGRPASAAGFLRWWRRTGRFPYRVVRRGSASRFRSSKHCMPSLSPSRMASSRDFPSLSPLLTYSRVRSVDFRISKAATRPLPSRGESGAAKR